MGRSKAVEMEADLVAKFAGRVANYAALHEYLQDAQERRDSLRIVIIKEALGSVREKLEDDFPGLMDMARDHVGKSIPNDAEGLPNDQ